MKKLNLETDYKINGNSTGGALDTGCRLNGVMTWHGKECIK